MPIWIETFNPILNQTTPAIHPEREHLVSADCELRVETPLAFSHGERVILVIVAESDRISME